MPDTPSHATAAYSAERPTPWADHEPAADPPPPLPPAELPEYDVLRELGRGGMGVVYLARNRLMDRLEALKVVARVGSADRFLREVRAAATLAHHPNVVAAYSARLVGGQVVFAMEYVDGDDLYRLVKAGGPLPPGRACEYARQAALGLQHAHEKGMVHRDVKPHNLIRAKDGAVKVLDFGLAALASEAPPGGPAGEVLGTPGFAAPEQAADPGAADARADVYGLGCTLFFLLTGSPPFPGRSLREVVQRQREADPAPLAARPGLPAGLAAVVARMMARDPADRYQTPGEAAAALARYADPGAGQGRAPAARPGRFRWVAAAAAGAALLAAAAALVPPRATPGPPTDPPTGGPGEWVSVFNGRDLSGWVIDGGGPTAWRVEDGALATTARRDGPRSWLLTDRDYADFRLRFEYQLGRGANSGVALRAVPGERPVLRPGGGRTPDPYHLQVELSDDSAAAWAKLPTGQVNGAGWSDGPALKPIRPARLRPPGEWNEAEVELRGQRVRVVVNGDVVQDASLDDLVGVDSPYPGLRRAAGRFGFQQQTRAARFRAVRVQDLAPQDPTGPGSIRPR